MNSCIGRACSSSRVQPSSCSQAGFSSVKRPSSEIVASRSLVISNSRAMRGLVPSARPISVLALRQPVLLLVAGSSSCLLITSVRAAAPCMRARASRTNLTWAARAAGAALRRRSSAESSVRRRRRPRGASVRRSPRRKRQTDRHIMHVMITALDAHHSQIAWIENSSR